MDLNLITPDEILHVVRTGKADSVLSDLDRAIKARQRAKGSSFRPGDKIRLNDTVRPRYLIGASGTIVRVNQKRCVVNFDSGQDLGRFAPGYGITVPFGMLEKA